MLFVLWFLVVTSTIVQAVQPLVDLSYTRYNGTVLNNGITQWLGMRYAAAPVGSLRFAPPQDPPQIDEILTADHHGLLCLSRGADPSDTTTSEDCLFLDVHAPSHATPSSNLPVYFFIQGGGFNSNSNANYNSSGLLLASNLSIIVVTFNYRVGPYGFLASPEIQNSPTSGVNNGLKDQRKALEWVQRHITSFGGNPNHVVLGGDSAGAASIAFHLTAYGGRNDGLFHGAAAESTSFATILTVGESKYQYDHFLSLLNCSWPEDGLSCLRNKSTAQLQTANKYNIAYPQSTHPPLYMWQPVIDNDLVTELPYTAFRTGRFIPTIPLLIGDDTNGGTIFTPRDTTTTSQFTTFLQDQFPYLTESQQRTILSLYPPDPSTTFPNSGPLWRPLSNAYGEMRYMCPSLYISSALPLHGQPRVWTYRYNVRDPTQVAQGYGVPHTVEVNAIWGPESIPNPQSVPGSYWAENRWIVDVMQRYWVNFIKYLDPNGSEDREGEGVAVRWEKWVDLDAENDGKGDVEGAEDVVKKINGTDIEMVWGRRMVFDTPTTTGVEDVDAGQKERCEYLISIGEEIRQ